MSHTTLQGEKHPLPIMTPNGLPIFNGDDLGNLDKHTDQFLAMCDIHSIII
jgi:hypothetical protein